MDWHNSCKKRKQSLKIALLETVTFQGGNNAEKNHMDIGATISVFTEYSASR
jgi:hypothetical protein